MNSAAISAADLRLGQIAQARQAVMQERRSPMRLAVEPWIEHSWWRCLASGLQPGQHLEFDAIPAEALRRVQDANHVLVEAARPVLEKLGRALANTRYFAILTDASGVVIDVNGQIDRSDRRAHLITRIGVDLSERAIGTSAISAALGERHPVWLHRGEHFFVDTSVYSCAGAPLFGPNGRCVGMLDLTGVEVAERAELKHLVAQSARCIEDALTLAHPHHLLVRLNWPGRVLGSDGDGLICLDADGWVTGANPAARQMVSQLDAAHTQALHCSELFALPFELLFDAARHEQGSPLDLPLWSGLLLCAHTSSPMHRPAFSAAAAAPRRGERQVALKDMEIALIRKAVDDAKGNVMKAAEALGISRATVYRKLGQGKRAGD